MTALLTSLGLLLGSAILALLFARASSRSALVAVAGAVAACVAGLVPVFRVLITGENESFRAPWLPALGGEFHVGIDPLSALFLVPLFVLCPLCAVYGRGYFAGHASPAREASAGAFFNLLAACMILVLVARNALLFLLAWEAMALTSFFLVTHDDDQLSVRRAGRVYLVATHLGTAFVLVTFFLLARHAGSLGFDAFAAAAEGLPVAVASGVFLCAVVGFGTKAGFVPFHVWLPEAHPAAPSHVSAVLSGVMIKTGIYGLFRVLTFLGAPLAWWGWLLIAVGLVSGVGGMLMALAQHDLKRLLAYSSVENIGIIALGMGTGLVGLSVGSLPVAVAGFAGALLHVVNHGLFKGLLFLGAGSVFRATGTREIDRLGGLLRRMPWTGGCFLIGAAAISGLPPLNGFLGEFLVFFGAFTGGVNALPGSPALLLLAVVAGLGLIGGLASACFTKAFGIVFLGEPRVEASNQPADAPPSMRFGMGLLAVLCVLIGLSGALVLVPLRPVLSQLTGIHEDLLAAYLGPVSLAMSGVGIAALGVVGLIVLAALLRNRALRGRPVETSVTWDCGYARPTARMQYTASSFAQPLVALFHVVIRSRRRFTPPEGLFPSRSHLESQSRDVIRERVFPPLFAFVDRWLSLVRRIQHGRIQLYILYILITLVVLLIWNLRSP